MTTELHRASPTETAAMQFLQACPDAGSNAMLHNLLSLTATFYSTQTNVTTDPSSNML